MVCSCQHCMPFPYCFVTPRIPYTCESFVISFATYNNNYYRTLLLLLQWEFYIYFFCYRYILKIGQTGYKTSFANFFYDYNYSIDFGDISVNEKIFLQENQRYDVSVLYLSIYFPCYLYTFYTVNK